MDHFYQFVRGWADFTDAYRTLVERMPRDRPSRIVELGCWFGKSAAFLGVEVINSGKPIEIVCVDHFGGSGPTAPNTNADAAGTDNYLPHFLHNLEPVRAILGERFRVIPKDTLSAARDIPEQSCDAVWVDAGHQYDEVKSDIVAWLPRVKPGGVMGGDDWNLPNVRRAVSEAFPNVVVSAGRSPWWWQEVP